MRARITFEIEFEVIVPDDLPEQVRQLARDLGENYVPVDATDEDILRRIALIRGLRGLDHDESMTIELNRQVMVSQVDDEEIVDFFLVQS